jgi:hypothetical protein
VRSDHVRLATYIPLCFCWVVNIYSRPCLLSPATCSSSLFPQVGSLHFAVLDRTDERKLILLFGAFLLPVLAIITSQLSLPLLFWTTKQRALSARKSCAEVALYKTVTHICTRSPPCLPSGPVIQKTSESYSFRHMPNILPIYGIWVIWNASPRVRFGTTRSISFPFQKDHLFCQCLY